MKTLSRRRSKAKFTPCSCLSWILFNVSVTALYFIVSSTIACAGQITLGWDKSTEADVVGYKIYYGTASGNYTQSIKIASPNIITCAILNLLNGQKYYFAATAYNSSLVESNYSAEVFATINPVTTSVPKTTTTVRPTTTTVRPTTTTVRPTTTTVRPTTTTVRPTTTTVRPTTTTVKPTTSISTTSLRPTTTTTVKPTTSISTTSLKPTTTTTVKPTITFFWNGSQTFSFQCIEAAVYEFRIVARGTPVSSVYPVMECQVDSNPPHQINVASAQWQTYAFSVELTEGSHQIKISFINDVYQPPEDRNLFISKIDMVGPTVTLPVIESLNVLSITAASLPWVVHRPILRDKKCLWLIVYPSQDHHFMPESSSIEVTGPELGAQGVTVDSQQSVKSVGRFILVPVCVERAASVGQWNITIKTDVTNASLDETIVTSFQVK